MLQGPRFGRFVPGSSSPGVVLATCCAFWSWLSLLLVFLLLALLLLAFLAPSVFVLGVAGTRGVAADDCLALCELWLLVLRVFRERVCAVGEDILLSERDGGGVSWGNSRAAYIKRSEREQGRKIAHKKVQVLAKMSRNQAP